MVGGVTPNGNVHISFFNERGPIPQLIEHEIEHDNSLGKEIVEARIGKIGVVREVDTDVIMNLATALAFKDWLDEKINTLQSAVNTQKEKS